MEDFPASHVRDFGGVFPIESGKVSRDRHVGGTSMGVVPRAGRYITGRDASTWEVGSPWNFKDLDDQWVNG